MKLPIAPVDIAFLPRYLHRLAVIVAVLALAGLLAVFATAGEAAPPTSTAMGVEIKANYLAATSDDKQLVRCIFCRSAICTGLDNLLGSAPADAAILPVTVSPVFPRTVVRLPQSRAPPLPSATFTIAFDPRGPPRVG